MSDGSYLLVDPVVGALDPVFEIACKKTELISTVENCSMYNPHQVP